MMAAKPEYYDKAHKQIYVERQSGHRINWERKLELARRVSRHVVGSVLDLGCGLGFLAGFVNGQYLGVDFSPYSIHRARAIGWRPAAKFIQADIHNLPDVGPFDTVAMIEVLEHFDADDRSGAVETAKRLARRRVVVSVPRGQSRCKSHLWNDITSEDVIKLLGPGTTCQQYRRKWIAIWEHPE